MPAKPASQTNIDSNLWAEALRVYTEDKGAEDRARGNTKRHQIAFESQGISAKTIRARYKEKNMTSDELAALFVAEQISRRALDLWSPDESEEFNRAMERATETQPADPEKLGALAGAHAYNDGFNGGAHGGLISDDNKHVPGTAEHQQWTRGVRDGIDYKQTFGTPAERQAPAMQEADEEAAPAEHETAPKKVRGRPRKTAAAAEPDTDLDQAIEDQLAAPRPEAPADNLFSDMPSPPGLPN